MTYDFSVRPSFPLLLACALAGVGPLPARGGEPPVISRGEPFDVRKNLVPESPTVFLFRAPGDAAGEKLLSRLLEKAGKDGKTAVRIVEAAGPDTAAAKSLGIATLPEALVYNRHGALVGRGGTWEAVEPHLAKALKTPRIKWIDTDDPEAEKAYGGKGAMVADIGKTMSLRPELLKGIMRVANQAHFSKGFLDVRTKEIIASYVSALNECRY